MLSHAQADLPWIVSCSLVFLYTSCIQFQTSWKEIRGLKRKPFPILVTVLSVQINHEHQNSARDTVCLSISPPKFCQLRSLTKHMEAQLIYSNCTGVTATVF